MTELPHPHHFAAAVPAFHRRSLRHDRDRALATLVAAKGQMRRLRRLIRQIAAGRLGVEQLDTVLLRRIHNGFCSLSDEDRPALLKLLLRAERCSDLLSIARGSSRIGQHPSNSLVGGLVALAHHHRRWLREPRSWCPPGRHPTVQFSHLARHLLAGYEIPAFMDSVWFLGPEAPAREQQGWFVHLGAGHNLRTAAGLPLMLSKKMVHHFLQAPAGSTVEEALRWGQIVGQGGSPALAAAVIGTRLGRSFEHEDFWCTVIGFLARCFGDRPSDLGEVPAIVDYIHHRRFEPQEVPSADGTITDAPPPEPNFSMKSRSLPKLLRQVARWRGDWAAAPPTLRNREATQRRRRFGYLDYEEVDPDTGHTIRWTIQQLTTPRSLVAEGQAMSHCVGGYRIKESSIWSLKAWDGDRDRRILTISIDADKRMVTQVAGRFNSDPARDLDRPAEFIDNPNGRIPPEELALLRRSRKILKLWLEREGLTYSSEGG